MDEALEVAEGLEAAGLEGVVVTLCRLLGVLLVLAGLGPWLLTDAGLLWLPAVLLVVGLLAVTIPGLLFELASVLE